MTSVAPPSHSHSESFRERLLGRTRAEVEQIVRNASPITSVRNGIEALLKSVVLVADSAGVKEASLIVRRVAEFARAASDLANSQDDPTDGKGVDLLLAVHRLVSTHSNTYNVSGALIQAASCTKEPGKVVVAAAAVRRALHGCFSASASSSILAPLIAALEGLERSNEIALARALGNLVEQGLAQLLVSGLNRGSQDEVAVVLELVKLVNTEWASEPVEDGGPLASPPLLWDLTKAVALVVHRLLPLRFQQCLAAVMDSALTPAMVEDRLAELAAFGAELAPEVSKALNSLAEANLCTFAKECTPEAVAPYSAFVGRVVALLGSLSEGSPSHALLSKLEPTLVQVIEARTPASALRLLHVAATVVTPVSGPGTLLGALEGLLVWAMAGHRTAVGLLEAVIAVVPTGPPSAVVLHLQQTFPALLQETLDGFGVLETLLPPEARAIVAALRARESGAVKDLVREVVRHGVGDPSVRALVTPALALVPSQTAHGLLHTIVLSVVDMPSPAFSDVVEAYSLRTVDFAPMQAAALKAMWDILEVLNVTRRDDSMNRRAVEVLRDAAEVDTLLDAIRSTATAPQLERVSVLVSAVKRLQSHDSSVAMDALVDLGVALHPILAPYNTTLSTLVSPGTFSDPSTVLDAALPFMRPEVVASASTARQALSGVLSSRGAVHAVRLLLPGETGRAVQELQDSVAGIAALCHALHGGSVADVLVAMHNVSALSAVSDVFSKVSELLKGMRGGGLSESVAAASDVVSTSMSLRAKSDGVSLRAVEVLSYTAPIAKVVCMVLVGNQAGAALGLTAFAAVGSLSDAGRAESDEGDGGDDSGTSACGVDTCDAGACTCGAGGARSAGAGVCDAGASASFRTDGAADNSGSNSSDGSTWVDGSQASRATKWTRFPSQPSVLKTSTSSPLDSDSGAQPAAANASARQRQHRNGTSPVSSADLEAAVMSMEQAEEGLVRALSTAIGGVPPGLPLPLTAISRAVADTIPVAAHVEKVMALASHVSDGEPDAEQVSLVASCVARVVQTVERVVTTIRRMQGQSGSRLATASDVVKRLLARLVSGLSPIPGKELQEGHGERGTGSEGLSGGWRLKATRRCPRYWRINYVQCRGFASPYVCAGDASIVGVEVANWLKFLRSEVQYLGTLDDTAPPSLRVRVELPHSSPDADVDIDALPWIRVPSSDWKVDVVPVFSEDTLEQEILPDVHATKTGWGMDDDQAPDIPHGPQAPPSNVTVNVDGHVSRAKFVVNPAPVFPKWEEFIQEQQQQQQQQEQQRRTGHSGGGGGGGGSAEMPRAPVNGSDTTRNDSNVKVGDSSGGSKHGSQRISTTGVSFTANTSEAVDTDDVAMEFSTHGRWNPTVTVEALERLLGRTSNKELREWPYSMAAQSASVVGLVDVLAAAVNAIRSGAVAAQGSLPPVELLVIVDDSGSMRAQGTNVHKALCVTFELLRRLEVPFGCVSVHRPPHFPQTLSHALPYTHSSCTPAVRVFVDLPSDRGSPP
jgi:hypothetical protein